MEIDFTENSPVLAKNYEGKNTMGVDSLDDRFIKLLHKKIMDKTGAAKRRAKKYYMDQYKKTGIIPAPLLLVEKGVLEGRKASGRPRVISFDVKNRFVEMVKASCDPDDPKFIFITRKARAITNFHIFLEEEFQQKISIYALRRLAKMENLDIYLKLPDFDEDPVTSRYFNPENVFDLVQVDGCTFQYFKIKDENGAWKKPQVIEFFDTGSRYMFVLDVYFLETSLNAVDLFTRFLLDMPFPKKKIRLRPDRAKGFLNLRRPIRELNMKYSLPDGFYMDPDFSAIRSPRHKVHLESSHRSLHFFEIRIIRHFEKRIAGTEPGFAFKGNKKVPITVTCLDISLQELKESRLIEKYRQEHNEKVHRFSENGKTQSWIPKQKLQAYLTDKKTILFNPDLIETFMRYGFDKKKACVSVQKTITYKKQKYAVVVGVEKFSSHKSTIVYISHYNNKLFIFEYKNDGILLGEAICQEASEKPVSVQVKAEKRLKANEVEQIATFLKNKNMAVDMKVLISIYRKGLTFKTAETLFEKNKARYDRYQSKLLDQDQAGFVRFNAFQMDCLRYLQKDRVIPYAKESDHGA